MVSSPVFIYSISDPRELQRVRYIGKTGHSLKTRLRWHLKDCFKGDNYRCRWIRRLISDGVKPQINPICIVEDTMANDTEKALIKVYKSIGVDLVNGTDGGDGSCGLSEESREKLRLRFKGIPRSEETKRKISASMMGNQRFLGRHHSNEAKEKISKALMGNKSRSGIKHSEETKAKISATKLFRKAA